MNNNYNRETISNYEKSLNSHIKQIRLRQKSNNDQSSDYLNVVIDEQYHQQLKPLLDELKRKPELITPHLDTKLKFYTKVLQVENGLLLANTTSNLENAINIIASTNTKLMIDIEKEAPSII